jgi:hypothetical protein
MRTGEAGSRADPSGCPSQPHADDEWASYADVCDEAVNPETTGAQRNCTIKLPQASVGATVRANAHMSLDQPSASKVAVVAARADGRHHIPLDPAIRLVGVAVNAVPRF